MRKESSQIGMKYLEGLDKGPEQDPDGVALAEELDQPRSSEQAQEPHVDKVFLE